MTHQIGQSSMGAAHRILHILLPCTNPYRKSVDEQSHYAVSTFPPLHASEQHCPEHHVLAPAKLAQHPRPRQMAQTRRAYTQPSRMRAHTPGYISVHHQSRLLDIASITLYLQ